MGEEMKRFALVICFLLMGLILVATSASAKEEWFLHLTGVDEGLAPGALPPAGFFFISDNTFAPFNRVYDTTGEGTTTKLNAVVEIPIMLWSSGWTVLGAQYAAAIAEPFAYTDLRIPAGNDTWIGGAQLGVFNTVLTPLILSWKLPDNFYVAFAQTVVFDDPQTSPADRVKYTTVSGNLAAHPYQPGGYLYAESGNANYMFQEEVGISWLYHGWNLSADFTYAISTKDYDTNYQSAPQFCADYTLSYTCGRWTFGFGAAQRNQFSLDQFDANDGTGYHSQPGTSIAEYYAGPLIGYNFGPCSLMVVYNIPISVKNDVGGQFVNFRFIVPLGNLGLHW